MGEITIYATKATYVDSGAPDTVFNGSDQIFANQTQKIIFLKFGTDNSGLYNKAISDIKLYITGNVVYDVSIGHVMNAIPFESITYNNQPSYKKLDVEPIRKINDEYSQRSAVVFYNYAAYMKNILENGIALFGGQADFDGIGSENVPYLKVIYNEANPRIGNVYNSDTDYSIYMRAIDETKNVNLWAQYDYQEYRKVVINVITPDQYTIKCRAAGSTGNYQTIQDGNLFYIPANSLTGDKYDSIIDIKFSNGVTTSISGEITTYRGVYQSIKNCIPSGGFVQSNRPLTFMWQLSQYNDEVPQKSATLEWKNKNESTVNTINITGSAQNYVMPPDTFTSDFVNWRVTVTNIRDKVVGPSEWIELTTVDSLSTCQLIQPVSTYVYGDYDTLFLWHHIASTGSEPTGADLQYSADDGANWVALASIGDAPSRYTVPAGTLPSGDIYWRARTYNANNIAGEWSSPAKIVVIAAPEVPIITSVDKMPRPTVFWQSNDQQAYQIKCEGYDSGEMYGTEKQFKIPVYLPDGETVIKVRVKNNMGIWSDWATASTTIDNLPGDSIGVTVSWAQCGVTLKWYTTGAYPRYYVYRNNKLIAKTETAEYTDYMAAGPNQYTVRGVTAADYYTDSLSTLGTTVIKKAVIGEVGIFDWLVLKGHIGSNPTHNETHDRLVNYVYYSGRNLPLAEISEFDNRQHTFSYSFASREEYNRLAALLGKMVVYKDVNGDIVAGILGSVSNERGRYINVSFSVMEVGEDAVQYD